MQTAAVIVAAGQGTRMGPGIDKLFLDLDGLPVVGHTWRHFDTHPAIHQIVLVIRPGQEAAFTALASLLQPGRPFALVPGGSRRQDSVWQGLEALAPDTQIVAIQDGARPCTSHRTITATLEHALQYGAAVSARRLTDTIKESLDGVLISKNVDRARLWSVQTPQAFQLEIIRRALIAVRNDRAAVTDDTAACEWIGQPVALVECLDPNPKVTVPADLDYVRLCLDSLANTRGSG